MEEHTLRLLENRALPKALGRERAEGRECSVQGSFIICHPRQTLYDQARDCATGGGLCGKHGGIIECTQSFGWEVCMGKATRKTWCNLNYNISTDLKQTTSVET